MFDEKSIKAKIAAQQAKDPSLTFRSAWNQLQKTNPYLFEGCAGGTGITPEGVPAILKRNERVLDLNERLMKYARENTGGMNSPEGMKLVQSIDGIEREIPEGTQLIQSVRDMRVNYGPHGTVCVQGVTEDGYGQ